MCVRDLCAGLCAELCEEGSASRGIWARAGGRGMAGDRGDGGCCHRVTFGFGAIFMQLSKIPRDLPQRAGARGLGVHEALHSDLYADLSVKSNTSCR